VEIGYFPPISRLFSNCSISRSTRLVHILTIDRARTLRGTRESQIHRNIDVPNLGSSNINNQNTSISPNHPKQFRSRRAESNRSSRRKANHAKTDRQHPIWHRWINQGKNDHRRQKGSGSDNPDDNSCNEFSDRTVILQCRYKSTPRRDRICDTR
jgi:hypothetical protein